MITPLDRIDHRPGAKSWMPMRPHTENPFDPRCKLHLQRICGTCTHYQGDLRPARIGHDPAAYNTAKCGYFGTTCHRLAKAGKCARWERKGGQE